MRFSVIQLFLTLIITFSSSIMVQSFVSTGGQLSKISSFGINNVQSKNPKTTTSSSVIPIVLSKQRRSIANVQMMGLFGLGAPEIAVILVAAAFLLGPQKLAELGKDAGKIAGELKEVPKEFQAGLREGEQSAQMAKKQEIIPEAITEAKIEEKKE